jgi:hypothetical protein
MLGFQLLFFSGEEVVETTKIQLPLPNMAWSLSKGLVKRKVLMAQK